LGSAFDALEIPFDCAQGRLSLRLGFSSMKRGYAREDALGNEAK